MKKILSVSHKLSELGIYGHSDDALGDWNPKPYHLSFALTAGVFNLGAVEKIMTESHEGLEKMRIGRQRFLS